MDRPPGDETAPDGGRSPRDDDADRPGDRPTAAGSAGSTGDDAPTDRGATGDRFDDARAGSPEVDDPLGDLLPRPGVDSRWWYWIAAIPLYVAVSAVFGLLFAVVALAGFGLGLEGGLIGFGLLFVLVVALGLAGLVLTVLFPVATYVDARAVAGSDASWTPDPLVWGLAALATVVLSAFVLSFVLAVYYLYKRHVAVGTP